MWSEGEHFMADRNDLRQSLAERFVPTLVIFLETPDKKPYDTQKILPDADYGDYHPCPVDLVFDHFRLNTGGLAFRRIGTAVRGRPPQFSTEREWLQSLVARGVDLRNAEINLEGFRPREREAAWQKFFEISRDPVQTDGRSALYPVVTYAHVIFGDENSNPLPPGDYRRDDAIIQYWMFYYYNDFRNVHEMDWEVAMVHVRDTAGTWQPVQAGFSAHLSGSRLSWSDLGTEGDSLLVFVAAGSHAQYFEHRENGYKTVYHALARWPVLERLVRNTIGRLGLGRYITKRMIDVVPPVGIGSHVRPEVRVTPTTASRDDPQWWWLNYEGKWGQMAPGVISIAAWEPTILRHGPRGPWVSHPGPPNRWFDPFNWLDHLPKADVHDS